MRFGGDYEICWSLGAPKEISLAFATSHAFQKGRRSIILNPFCNDRNSKRPCEINDGSDDHAVLFVFLDLHDK